jgi:hypothetical protein
VSSGADGRQKKKRKKIKESLGESFLLFCFLKEIRRELRKTRKCRSTARAMTTRQKVLCEHATEGRTMRFFKRVKRAVEICQLLRKLKFCVVLLARYCQQLR